MKTSQLLMNREFKIGDVVRVRSYSEDTIPKRLWVHDMIDTCGHTVTIADMKMITSHGLILLAEENGFWYYPTDFEEYYNNDLWGLEELLTI